MNKFAAFVGVGLFALSTQSHATPVTIDFSITSDSAYAGYAAGSAGGGYFTYDDSIFDSITPYADGSRQYIDPNVEGSLRPLALEFSWLGTHWDATQTGFLSLSFRADRSLFYWQLGGLIDSCGFTFENNVNCVNSVGPTDFWLTGSSGGGGMGVMHLAGSDGYTQGFIGARSGRGWSVRPSASVPEPSALILFMFGLAAAFGCRKLARNQSAQ